MKIKNMRQTLSAFAKLFEIRNCLHETPCTLEWTKNVVCSLKMAVNMEKKWRHKILWQTLLSIFWNALWVFRACKLNAAGCDDVIIVITGIVHDRLVLCQNNGNYEEELWVNRRFGISFLKPQFQRTKNKAREKKRWRWKKKYTQTYTFNSVHKPEKNGFLRDLKWKRQIKRKKAIFNQ